MLRWAIRFIALQFQIMVIIELNCEIMLNALRISTSGMYRYRGSARLASMLLQYLPKHASSLGWKETRLTRCHVVNRSIGVLRADLIKICLIRLPWRFLAILPSNYRRCIPVLDLVRKTQANYGTSGCPYNHIKGVAYFDITERIHDAAHWTTNSSDAPCTATIQTKYAQNALAIVMTPISN